MISIIFPVFNEEGNLNALYARLIQVTSRIKSYSFEFIFVDDASTDKTPEILEGLFSKDKRIKVIRFVRNSGSHLAIAEGIRHCRGRCAVNLASDLQDPPELIPGLLNEWNKGSKVVWAIRGKRKGGGFLKIFFSKLYYCFMNRFTTVHQPNDGADVFCIDRTVIDVFKKRTDMHKSIFMAVASMGFKSSEISYVKEVRYAGKSKWTIMKKIKLFLKSFILFNKFSIQQIKSTERSKFN